MFPTTQKYYFFCRQNVVAVSSYEASFGGSNKTIGTGCRLYIAAGRFKAQWRKAPLTTGTPIGLLQLSTDMLRSFTVFCHFWSAPFSVTTAIARIQANDVLIGPISHRMFCMVTLWPQEHFIPADMILMDCQVKACSKRRLCRPILILVVVHNLHNSYGNYGLCIMNAFTVKSSM